MASASSWEKGEQVSWEQGGRFHGSRGQVSWEQEAGFMRAGGRFHESRGQVSWKQGAGLMGAGGRFHESWGLGFSFQHQPKSTKHHSQLHRWYCLQSGSLSLSGIRI